MRIALVEDEPVLLQNLYAALAAALEKSGAETGGISSFSSGEDFLKAWQPGGFDIIILDIYMKGLSGIDVARRIRETDADVALAFCTSSNAFASESYEVGAGYYLQKPISEEKIAAMLKRLDLSRLRRRRFVRLPDGTRCLARQIIFTEYSNHYVTFHISGSSAHVVYMSHGQAEELLLHDRQFCCINKGCIVNLAMVRDLTENAFRMEGGETVPIARRRYKEVRESYTRFRFEQLDQEVGV